MIGEEPGDLSRRHEFMKRSVAVALFAAGSGTLADDIVATWQFAYNASPWSYTFRADGRGRGTQKSGIVGERPSSST